jgi:hypothetical protein
LRLAPFFEALIEFGQSFHTEIYQGFVQQFVQLSGLTLWLRTGSTQEFASIINAGASEA